MTAAKRDFCGALPPEYRDRLLALGHDTSLPAGVRLFEEDQEADRFWILQSGRVTLDITEPGRGAVVLETLGEGELLGWSWLFEPYRWHLGAGTVEPVEAREFDARRVRTAIDEDPAFGLAVTRCVASVAIGRRLRASRLRLLDLYGPPADRRHPAGGDPS